MDIQHTLTTSEWAALREVSRGPFQEKKHLTDADIMRLLDQKLIYLLSGDLRITAAGKAKLLLAN
jgi:hypothetical protein